jgi:hypothetical protein
MGLKTISHFLFWLIIELKKSSAENGDSSLAAGAVAEALA